MCVWVCLWPLARALFWMTGRDWRCWSLKLLDLKLNGQINRCCHFLLWNHLLVSTPIWWQHLFIFSLIDTSICPMPRRQSLATNQSIAAEKQISEMTNSRRKEREKKKKFDESYFAHSAVFMMCLYQVWNSAAKWHEAWQIESQSYLKWVW